MPRFFSNKKLIVLMSALIILVGLIGFSLNDRKQSTAEQFLQDTVGWFQMLFHTPAQYVAGFFETIEDIKDVYEENQLLKSRIKDYAEVKTLYHQLQLENEKLREQLELKNDPSLIDYKKHRAMVIGRSFDEWNKLLTVNKGAQNGIKRGMAVITSDGMIGKVTETGQFTSVVTLMTDPMSLNHIPAAVSSNKKNIYGMIEAYNPDKNVLLLKKLRIDADIKKGMRVITSGLGKVYPRGLYIGEVVKVDTDRNGLSQTAEIKPAAAFNNIDYVNIIERKAPVSQPKKEDQE